MMPSTSDYPFELHLLIPTAGYVGQLEVVLTCGSGPHLHPADASALTLEPSVSLVKLFAAAMDVAALGGDPMMSLVSHESKPEHERLVFDVAGLCSDAFVYLVSVALQGAIALDPLRRLSVRPLGDADIAWTESELHEVGAVPLPMEAPFGVDPWVDITTFSHGFEVSVEFVDPLTPERFGEVREALARWDEMRMVGGFYRVLEECDPGAMGLIVHRLPRVVVLEVSDPFEGDPAAIHGLVYACARLHVSTPLKHLTIEPR